MTVSDKKEEYQQTLNESFKLLDENQEWIERYAGYISKINSTYFPLQCRFIREIVHINWPLAAYLNITSVTQSGMNIDLRLMGTSIATLYVQARTLETQDYNMIKSGNISAIDKSKLNQFVNISFKGKESACGIFPGWKLSGAESGSGPAHGGRGPYRWQPYVSSQKYV